MATALKNARTLQASATQTAAAADTNGTTIDLRTALGMVVTMKVTNGGTGPTVGCTYKLQISVDGSAWKTFFEGLAGVTLSVAYETVIEIPPAVMYVRSVFGGNTGQNVTIEAFGHELTAVE